MAILTRIRYTLWQLFLHLLIGQTTFDFIKVTQIYNFFSLVHTELHLLFMPWCVGFAICIIKILNLRIIKNKNFECYDYVAGDGCGLY